MKPKIKIKKIKSLVITVMLICALTGCGSTKDTTTSQVQEEAMIAESDEVVTTSTVTSTWDDSATEITLSETSIRIDGEGASEKDGMITISSAGTYVISGTLEDGQIQIDADKEDSVHIVLNGVTITCADSAAIYAKTAKEVILTVADGTENTLIDGKTYVYAEETETDPDAAIFSKADLYMNGSGTLTVNGNYNHAIVAKDAMYVDDASITIAATADGIHVNDTLVISSGVLNVTAGDDAIHTDTTLTVNGGAITISECQEGLEGSSIEINEGEITVTSNDDGINAANSEETEVSHDITINGGTVLVNAMGDGIDANGSIIMTGGNVTVYGPTNDGNGSVDYDGTFDVLGGTLLVAGSSGMAQGISDTSTQNGLIVVFDEQQEAGTTFEIVSADGTSIASITPAKAYQCVLISIDTLAQDTEYTIKSNGEELTNVTLSQVMTCISEDGSEAQIGMMGGNGGPGGKMQGEAPEPPADGEMPAGGPNKN